MAQCSVKVYIFDSANTYDDDLNRLSQRNSIKCETFARISPHTISPILSVVGVSVPGMGVTGIGGARVFSADAWFVSL